MQKIVKWLSPEIGIKNTSTGQLASTEGIGAVLWDVMISEQARSAIKTL